MVNANRFGHADNGPRCRIASRSSHPAYFSNHSQTRDCPVASALGNSTVGLDVIAKIASLTRAQDF